MATKTAIPITTRQAMATLSLRAAVRPRRRMTLEAATVLTAPGSPARPAGRAPRRAGRRRCWYHERRDEQQRDPLHDREVLRRRRADQRGAEPVEAERPLDHGGQCDQ